ncbi:hypothetical protein [Salarchaeum sp. JOR-1]|uniref:hypothetical protein n=1 Tax=Salarchaeum sp. JOR-1 TaxID=2599399 RepID=UPI001198B9D7|nr:hypothetical protein [Salarchaeum sp. JOR-1]QDX40413.1 hypothetical protein FQU85_05680 [Salarchaeum sp. JOR-1]
MATLTPDDEGKFLVDIEGEQLGIVTAVEDNTAWVDPEPGLGESVLAAFGWTEKGEDDYTVSGDAVDTVTGEEVRVHTDI